MIDEPEKQKVVDMPLTEQDEAELEAAWDALDAEGDSGPDIGDEELLDDGEEDDDGD